MQNEEQLRRLLRDELSRSTLPKLYDSRSTADILGISPGTLNNWRTVGRGPRVTFVGGAVRYQLTEINDWLQAHTEGRA